MGNPVTVTIDGKTISVPQGMLVVDAAKKIGIDIPVFCYHPKMEPVGMCRMCLVDIGRPVIDRTTGQPVMEADGKPRVQFAPKLETACTTPVSEGMVVITVSDKVATARKELVEFILTSHPLDCPVCDKGGECPLQNQTMDFGAGQSRFIFDEKMHLAKRVPLGELIFLDRERCIQCSRCVRFENEVVDDPVLALSQRGRALEIITNSQPGFNSIFSGNTTDICPVGALSTADFRFGARPWEMNQAASVCNHCPVGCNLTFNVRREARSDGKQVIKRVMPRQNEAVNEIWICDKGRFVYQYAESPERLQQPLARKDGQLIPVSWDEALERVTAGLKQAGSDLVGLAGGRLSNEDLFNLRQLTAAQGGQAVLYGDMAGGDLTAKLGLGPGSNLGDLGKGSVVVVVASDLHQEAPLWWLRLKQAAKRGAALIVINARPTRLEKYATHVIRCDYGQEADVLAAFAPGQVATDERIRAAAAVFVAAENGMILFGQEGLDGNTSAELARACAEALVKSGHYGMPNNGLVGVWPHGNTQGAWDMGFRSLPAADLAMALAGARAVYVAAADPAGDAPAFADALDQADFVVVNELFLTETAKRADVVLPVQAYTEREGTYTSGERRVQRFYPAVAGARELRADFAVFAKVGKGLGLEIEGRAAALVFQNLAGGAPGYTGLNYQRLAEVVEQWPFIGRADVYYGGTGYDNHQGLGVQLPNLVTSGAAVNLPEKQTSPAVSLLPGALRLVLVTRLYDRGSLMLPSRLLEQRLAPAELWLHPQSAAQRGLLDGQVAEVELNGARLAIAVKVDESVPVGAALLPRSVGTPVVEPGWVVFVRQLAQTD